ncbi:MAG: tripartite tricarboxylate transporter permease [Deltaproteobacteria bacterium]|nr:tripartite tricarboxylate transporter permease [Deltaproteobacteria bacterium]
MIDAFFSGLLQVLSWPAFGFMLVGIALGFVVGILPGLGGTTTLALMLPFIYDMSPVSAFAFLLGMNSVTATTGDITAVLFAVPGETSTAVTILDGHPMAKRGEAGRALGAALFSSLVGSLLGAFTLLVAIPILVPVALALGSPEMFMLGMLGISYLAVLSGGSMTRGLVMGGLGLLLATIGPDPWTATYRYTLGQVYLWEGMPLVPFIVGLFAIPEIVDLAVKGTAIAEAKSGKLSGVMQGVKDTFRYWKVTVRASIIGIVIGIIPGVGGAAASWIAYAQAVQAAPDRSRFGKGAIEGVLAAGAVNNAKEGGSLIPTLAFGVPGSGGMAVLLGAFLILGINPGPDMLTKHLDVTFSMAWTIIIANVVTVALSFIFLNQLAKLTQVKSTTLIPFILLAVYLGSFATNNSIADLLTTLIFGTLGCLMVLFKWPRPPLVLGVVLGEIIEKNLFISIARYGLFWIARPGVIVLFLLIIGGILYGHTQNKKTVMLKEQP